MTRSASTCYDQIYGSYRALKINYTNYNRKSFVLRIDTWSYKAKYYHYYVLESIRHYANYFNKIGILDTTITSAKKFSTNKHT